MNKKDKGITYITDSKGNYVNLEDSNDKEVFLWLRNLPNDEKKLSDNSTCQISRETHGKKVVPISCKKKVFFWHNMFEGVFYYECGG